MSRWLIGLSLWISVSAWAQTDYYFTVHEPSSVVPIIELLNFDRHEEPLEEPSEKYNRARHYGVWIEIEDCYDTRAMVLIRDSKTSVSFNPRNHCKVSKGKWADPYSGKIFSSAADIQIDHMVPLKNSYISGAWKWDSKTRCLYANFLGNDFHLLAVSGSENQSKSDKTPEGWMPSKKSYSCEYLKNWLQVKLIWNLALTPSETAAIKKLAKDNSCSQQKMRTTFDLLLKNRQFIVDNADLCQ